MLSTCHQSHTGAAARSTHSCTLRAWGSHQGSPLTCVPHASGARGGVAGDDRGTGEAGWERLPVCPGWLQSPLGTTQGGDASQLLCLLLSPGFTSTLSMEKETHREAKLVSWAPGKERKHQVRPGRDSAAQNARSVFLEMGKAGARGPSDPWGPCWDLGPNAQDQAMQGSRLRSQVDTRICCPWGPLTYSLATRGSEK